MCFQGFQVHTERVAGSSTNQMTLKMKTHIHCQCEHVFVYVIMYV